MSIISNMEAVILQVKTRVETKSGYKDTWADKETIYVSIYKTNDMINTQSVKYNESTHTGLTFYKDIKEGVNRLLDDKGFIYEIKGANPKGRLTNLLLKVVDTNV